MQPIPEGHALRRLFRGLIDNAFCTEVGLCAPELTDYLADLLVSFVHTDAIYALPGVARGRFRELGDVLVAISTAQQVTGRADRARVHRHVGDFTLFWSGLYPECLRHHRGLAGKDQLLDYVAQGKRCYDIAAQLADADTAPSPTLLNQLSVEFELCCHGLGLVRRGWEESDPGGSGEFRALVY